MDFVDLRHDSHMMLLRRPNISQVVLPYLIFPYSCVQSGEKSEIGLHDGLRGRVPPRPPMTSEKHGLSYPFFAFVVPLFRESGCVLLHVYTSEGVVWSK